MQKNYFSLFLMLLLLLVNCKSTSEKKDSYKSSSKEYTLNNLSDHDYLEPIWSKDNSTFITVFKYTVSINSKEWAAIFLYGVAFLYKRLNSTKKMTKLLQ